MSNATEIIKYIMSQPAGKRLVAVLLFGIVALFGGCVSLITYAGILHNRIDKVRVEEQARGKISVKECDSTWAARFDRQEAEKNEFINQTIATLKGGPSALDAAIEEVRRVKQAEIITNRKLKVLTQEYRR